MFKLLALVFALLVLGPVALLLLAIVALPLFLMVKAAGVAVRLTFGLVGGLLGLAGALLVGLFLLPVMLLAGGLLLIKLLVLALPLLMIGGLIWLVVHLTSRPRRTLPA